MGLIVLILIGITLGWLVSIVFRDEEPRTILFLLASGVFGSLVAGIAAGGGALLAALGAWQLMWSALGAITCAILVHFVVQWKAIR